MADLAVQQVTLAGLTATERSIASGGDKFVNDGQTRVTFINKSTSAVATVTVASQVKCNQGETHNLTITVPASSQETLPVLAPSRFNDKAGKVNLSYSGTALTSLKATLLSG